ncbi:hypothetical protein DFH28DRAFT_922812 [Melampsora americana]|nr:hypothetical protein DFH28DRAFT_922812 [Melampsora americana]
MTSSYIYCQHATKNWTSEESYIGTKPPGCNCTQAQQNLRNIDLIDSLDAVQLLYHGYIASSLSKPRTAFLIRLLQFYHAMWQAAGLSKGGFIKGLLTFIAARNHSKLVGQALAEKTRALRIPFSNTFDVYTQIHQIQSTLFSEGMIHTTKDLWAAKCPRCFGPAKNEDRTNQELYSIFCMDENFQQRHNTQSSKDVPTNDQYPAIFVKPSEVNQNKSFMESTINMPIKAGQNPCLDSLKAANNLRNTSTWAHCDDTGLFAASCQHDVPLQLVNIYKTGEKLYYPVTLIKSIIKDFPGKRFGVLYDIGCHLEKHLKSQNLLPKDRACLRFGTSVFHAGKWLLARMNQAISKTQKSQTLLTNIYAQANPHKEGKKYTEELFIEQWAAERKAMLDPKSQQEEQKLELGELLCLEDDLDIAWNSVAQTPQQALTQARREMSVRDCTTGWNGYKIRYVLKGMWRGIMCTNSNKSGQRGQEKVLASIKACAAKLRPALDTYNQHLTAFKAAFPDCVAPKAMDFKNLLASEPDDQFWNDGLFTHGNKPWESDCPTQVGMRAWARLRRCNEEKQSTLTSLAPEEQTIAVKVLVSKQFDRVCQLYKAWNTPVLEVFRMNGQVTYLQSNGYSSKIPGDFVSLIEGVIRFCNITSNIVPDVADMGGVAGNINVDEEDENNWQHDVEDIFEWDMNLEEIHMVLQQNESGEDDD